MSNALLSKAWKVPLDPSSKLVLVRLADQANERAECWPSLATIAAETGLAKSSVCRVLDALDAEGLLVRLRGNLTTTYRLKLGPIQEGGAVPPSDTLSHHGTGGLSHHGTGSPQETPEACPTMGHPCPTIGQGGVPPWDTPVPPSDSPCPTMGHKPSYNPQDNTSSPASKKSGRQDWRDKAKEQAHLANTVKPDMLAPEEFRAAWSVWAAYRTRRAVEAHVASQSLPWNAAAAEAGLRECNRYSGSLGWDQICGRIDQAISANWQGLNLSTIKPLHAQSTSSTHRQPHSARAGSGTANGTGRYAAKPQQGGTGGGSPVAV